MNRVSSALIGVGVLFAAATGVASADRDNGTDAFLCPIVGEAAGGTFLPGVGQGQSDGNQAGTHANQNGINSVGDGTPGPGNTPGADGFTPIWSGPPA